MGDVVSLSRRQATREARARVRAERGSFHPALRWVAGEVYYLAHRKNRDGEAACGADGAQTLAPPGVPLCSQCCPQTGSG